MFGLWRIDANGWQRFAHSNWSKFPLPADVTDPAKMQIRSIVEDSKQRVWCRTIHRQTEYYAVEGEQLTVYRNVRKGYFVCYGNADGSLLMADGKGQTAILKTTQSRF